MGRRSHLLLLGGGGGAVKEKSPDLRSPEVRISARL